MACVARPGASATCEIMTDTVSVSTPNATRWTPLHGHPGDIRPSTLGGWTATALTALAALLAGAVPAVLRYSPHAPNWDELYFLHRAVCVNRAAFALDLPALDLCLSEMVKSPILAFMLLFAGDIQGRAELLMLMPVVLAAVSLGIAVLMAWMAQAARLPLAAIVLGGLACALVPHTLAVGGLIFVDTLFALTVAATMMLLPLEMGQLTAPSWRGHAARGILWGVLASLGVLGKLTYGVFILAVFPVLAVLTVRRYGLAVLLLRVAAAVVVSLPAALVILRYMKNYVAHAAGSSFGNVAQFYDSGLAFGALVREQLLGTGYGAVPLALLALLAVFMVVRRPRDAVAPLYLLAVLSAYFLLVSASPNRDPRFYLPFWFALPWVLASFAWGTGRAGLGGWRAATPAGLALCVVLALPTAGSLDLRFVTQSRDALAVVAADRALQEVPQNAPPRLLIGSDAGGLNIESLLLAQQLAMDPAVRSQRLDTLVYDIVRGVTPEGSVQRLRAADYLLSQSPPDPGAPEWSNRFHGLFLEEARGNGDVVATLGGGSPLSVFRMRHP